MIAAGNETAEAMSDELPFKVVRSNGTLEVLARSTLGWMILQAREHVGEPGLRVDVVEPGGLDQGVDRSSAMTARIGTREGPVPATQRERADLPLGCIVRHAQAPTARGLHLRNGFRYCARLAL
jgi:hypothetical protein